MEKLAGGPPNGQGKTRQRDPLMEKGHPAAAVGFPRVVLQSSESLLGMWGASPNSGTSF